MSATPYQTTDTVPGYISPVSPTTVSGLATMLASSASSGGYGFATAAEFNSLIAAIAVLQTMNIIA